jgi:tRNA(Leu) C34 or U34 (ribose-2'-O)-methylase TrmL
MGSAGGASASYVYLKQRKSREKERTNKAKVRRWECVQLTHHNDIGRKIEEWESNGWMLYAYTTAQFQNTAVNHYLLFLKEE